MNRVDRINQVIEDLEKKGSTFENRDELINRSLELTKKDISLEEVINSIRENMEICTKDFLIKKSKYDINYISGISSCIYIPSFDNSGEIKLKFIGGNSSRNNDLKINENTLFDVASITKLYTLILAFEFERIGLINLNERISDVDKDFKGLEDFTFNDLIRLCGEIETKGNITSAKSIEEAYTILKTASLKSNDRTINKYTDFGAIIIGEALCKRVKETYNIDLKFEDLIDMFILTPLNLKNTLFNPKTTNTSGNNSYNYVHDPKARILGGAVGSAGIFTTSDDLAKLAKAIYSVNYINKKFLSSDYVRRMGEIPFPESPSSNKGNLGLYVKHPRGLDKTYTPNESAKFSFSMQGWTGSIAIFDPYNLIHQNILVNSILESNDKDIVLNDKPRGFGGAMDEYLKQITFNTMLTYIAKKYYNTYCNSKESIDKTSKVVR